MSEEQRHYWYVVFSWSTKTGSGWAQTNINTSLEWFPIAAAVKYIKNSGYDNVVITSWTKISKEQYDQFIEEKKDETNN